MAVDQKRYNGGDRIVCRAARSIVNICEQFVNNGNSETFASQ